MEGTDEAFEQSCGAAAESVEGREHHRRGLKRSQLHPKGRACRLTGPFGPYGGERQDSIRLGLPGADEASVRAPNTRWEPADFRHYPASPGGSRGSAAFGRLP